MRILCNILLVLFCVLNSIVVHPSERLQWDAVLRKTRQRDPRAALALMQDRYASLRYGAEKLYMSSLIHDFMIRQSQYYYPNSPTINSIYQQNEKLFLDSLMAESQNQFNLAEQGYITLYQRMKQAADRDGKFLFEYHLCRLYNHQGRFFKGQFYCDQLSHQLSESNNLIPHHRVLTSIAKNQASTGDYQSALTSYKNSMDLLPNGESPAPILKDIAQIFCALGQYEQALEYLYRALALHIENNAPSGIAKVEKSLGTVYFRQRDFTQSIAHLNKARIHFINRANSKQLAYVHFELGRAYTELGQFHNGINYLLKSLDYAIKYKDMSLKTNTSLALSGSYLTKNYFKQAHYYAMKAKNLAQQTLNNKTETEALRQLAMIAARSEDYQQALSFYQQYTQNEIKLRSSQHTKAFKALGLSKQKLEQKLIHSDLFDDNVHLKHHVKQLSTQRFILLTTIVVLAIWIVLLWRKLLFRNHLASIDCLTQALHRPAFIQRLSKLKKRSDNHCLILLLDLESLKAINDNLGYKAGNQVLRNVSLVIENQLLKEDFWGRLSGKKFTVAFSHVEPDEAHFKVERFYQALTQVAIDSDQPQPVTVTASLSYLSITAQSCDFDRLYPILDRALNQSKCHSNNRIINACQYTT